MDIMRWKLSGLVAMALSVLFGYGMATGKLAPRALAQQPGPKPGDGQPVTPPPGSPEATRTVDGRYLPNPPQPFGGEITPNALTSKPYWPARTVPPKGAPNVLLIMTDDTGFGAAS